MSQLQKPVAVIAGPFPPPVHGFAVITAALAAALDTFCDCRRIDLSPHRARGGLTYHRDRLLLTLRGIPIVVRAAREPSPFFYAACEGGFGLIYTLMLVATARAARLPVFIHHHSFAYIDRKKLLMRLLVTLAGGTATHIFLGPAMAKGFAGQYGDRFHSALLPNSAFVPMAANVARPARPLTIGLLSNLNAAKGLDDFIALARAALAEGLAIRAVLAGPAPAPRDQSLIDAAVGDLGDRFDYRGPVHGAAKAAFFDAIDVFIFPTRYVNEAQPTVLYEAQAHGVPALAFDRGCIRDQIGAFGATLPRDGDFTAFALAWLRRWITDPAALAQLQLDARAGFMKQSAAAKRSIATLFDLSQFKSWRDATPEPHRCSGTDGIAPTPELRRLLTGTMPMSELPTAPRRPYRVDIWHNILWSRYKGEVFSSIERLHDPAAMKFRFFQIAETEGNRTGLAGVDLRYHRYPYDLLFTGAYDAVPTWRRVARIAARTWASDADMIIITGYHTLEGWAQLAIMRLRGRKVAVFCDSTAFDNPPNRLRGLFKKVFFRSVHAIFCYGARSRAYVIGCGADPAIVHARCQAAALPETYSPAAARAKRLQLAASPDAPHYVYVGRLSPEKDLDTLLTAFATVRAQMPKATLSLVGGGPQRDALAKRIATENPGDAVTLAGSLSGEALFDVYAGATCLMLPSRSEPWGLVVNEALSYGCPAIVSDHCGCVPELIIDGVTGYVHRTGDADDLAARMLQAPRQFADTARTADDCMALIAKFSPDNAANQIILGLQAALQGVAA